MKSSKKSAKKAKRRAPTPDQLEKRAKSAFKRKIVKTFTDAGFSYLQTNDQ